MPLPKRAFPWNFWRNEATVHHTSRRQHMAVNKPVGDNARKGAVRKRTQLKTKTVGEKHWTKHSKGSGEFMDQKKEGEGRKIQGRPAGDPAGDNESFVSLGPVSLGSLAERLLPGMARIAFRQTEAMEADNFGRRGNASQPRAAWQSKSLKRQPRPESQCAC
jgi:hypothetical protein